MDRLCRWRNSRHACIPKYAPVLADVCGVMWRLPVLWCRQVRASCVSRMTQPPHFPTDISRLKSGYHPDAYKCSAVPGRVCIYCIALPLALKTTWAFSGVGAVELKANITYFGLHKNRLCIIQYWWTNFPKILEPSQNSRRLEECHEASAVHTEEPQILRATVQNLLALATLNQWSVHPCSRLHPSPFPGSSHGSTRAGLDWLIFPSDFRVHRDVGWVTLPDCPSRGVTNVPV
jgi:hypothetical protein